MSGIFGLSAEEHFSLWAEREGWKVTKRGWPDFICRRPMGRMAVEVKHGADRLTWDQRRTLKDLHAAGWPTFIWTIKDGLQPWPRRGGGMGVIPADTELLEEVASLKEEVAAWKAKYDELSARHIETTSDRFNRKTRDARLATRVWKDLFFLLDRCVRLTYSTHQVRVVVARYAKFTPQGVRKGVRRPGRPPKSASVNVGSPWW